MPRKKKTTVKKTESESNIIDIKTRKKRDNPKVSAKDWIYTVKHMVSHPAQKSYFLLRKHPKGLEGFVEGKVGSKIDYTVLALDHELFTDPIDLMFRVYKEGMGSTDPLASLFDKIRTGNSEVLAKVIENLYKFEVLTSKQNDGEVVVAMSITVVCSDGVLEKIISSTLSSLSKRGM